MQNMVVIGNWMITQMKLGSDNPYLNLAYRPQDFEKRDKTKDQKLLSKKVGSIDTKIESFRAQEDPFSSTKDNTEILLAVKKQIMDLNENKATYLLEVHRAIICSCAKAVSTLAESSLHGYGHLGAK